MSIISYFIYTIKSDRTYQNCFEIQLLYNGYLQNYLDDLSKVIFNYLKVLLHDSPNNVIVVKPLLVASDGSV